MSTSSSSSSGIGCTGLLTIIFIVLKLIGERFHTPVADWSWWWVLAPTWIPLALLGLFLLFCLAMHSLQKVLK